MNYKIQIKENKVINAKKLEGFSVYILKSCSKQLEKAALCLMQSIHNSTEVRRELSVIAKIQQKHV
jgi:hypothetical protein